jgi:hypothetical protein
MTELTYLSNHFFHPINTEFSIRSEERRNLMPQGEIPSVSLAYFSGIAQNVKDFS